VSVLRARCPHCRTLTAVAFDERYECHSCGADFGAGLVRVPRAWGEGGEDMAEAAHTSLPYPTALVVERDSLGEQTEELAGGLPRRPLVLGGCCCAHTGAIRGLARRHGRLGVVWLDAHGDLNTPESSPSGNAWGMPLREALDAGDVLPGNVALVGARDLDPSERAYVEEHGLDDDLERALLDVDAVYLALDLDVLQPGLVPSFMPVPGGPGLDEVEEVVRRASRLGPVAGLGLTGLASGVEPATLTRFAVAAGL